MGWKVLLTLFGLGSLKYWILGFQKCKLICNCKCFHWQKQMDGVLPLSYVRECCICVEEMRSFQSIPTIPTMFRGRTSGLHHVTSRVCRQRVFRCPEEHGGVREKIVSGTSSGPILVSFYRFPALTKHFHTHVLLKHLVYPRVCVLDVHSIKFKSTCILT